MLANVKLEYLDYVELFLDFVAPFLNLYFLVLLRKTIFHLNLRILLGNFALGLCFLTIFRIPLLLDTFFEFLKDLPNIETFLHIVHNSFVILIVDGAILLTVERVFATVYADKYEHVVYTHVTVFSSCVLWIFNFGIAFMSQMRMNQSFVVGNLVIYGEGAMKTPVDLIILLVLNIVSVLIFFILLFTSSYNRRQYRVSSADQQLTQRYQLSENIRTGRQLSRLMIANVIISSYIFVSLYFLSLNENRNFWTTFVTGFYEFVCSLACVLFPLILIWTHPKLKMTFLSHFSRKKKIDAMRTINDLPLIVKQNAQQQKQLYFDELKKSWK
ncbi:hypothetical protein L596_028907 [Steinernema carpocapsae]|nr:hypothetical protein L596_028907 [Steinernema carpocapsae]